MALLLAACGGKGNKQSAQARTGADRDDHGCIASAGYTWSEARKDCVRLWEAGVRMVSVEGDDHFLFLVFSPDSARVELFYSVDDKPNEMLDRRTLPTGESVWNVEDDDTKIVCLTDGRWTVSRRGKLEYKEADEPRKQP